MIRQAGFSGLCLTAAIMIVACGDTSLGLRTTSATTPVTYDGPESRKDVLYGKGQIRSGTKDLLLDIYQPQTDCTEPRPFVILIHGGGFVSGSKNQRNWPRIAEGLTDRGYVALAIDYRVEPDNPIPSQAFLPIRSALLETIEEKPTLEDTRLASAVVSSLEDSLIAYQWAMENAEAECLDPERSAIWGSSAGAVLALMMGYNLDEFGIDAPKPDAVIDYMGRPLFSGAISYNDPPLFILHGDADKAVEYEFAEDLRREARQAGLPHSFFRVAGAGHSMVEIPIHDIAADGKTLAEHTYAFIDAHLRDGSRVYETRTIHTAK